MTGANPMRGEVPLGEHKLIVNVNSVCALEEATGRKLLDLVADMEFDLGLSDLRQWIKVFLDKDMTLLEVGDLLGEIGIEEASSALGRAFEMFFPAPKKGKEKNPLKAA